MRRMMLFGFSLVIAVACSMMVHAQPLRIDSVSPQTVERGGHLVIFGSLGPRERGKVIRFARVVDRRAEFFYPTVLRWTADQAEVIVARSLPIDRYVVTVVYPDRPTRHSNNFVFTVREPPPPAVPGHEDNPVVVLPNWCVGHPPKRTSRVEGGTERSSGASNAPCETMRAIYDANVRFVQPGGDVTIRGDFGDRRGDQYVALAKFVEVDSERQGQSQRRWQVSHLLQIVAWSRDRITVRVGDFVNPDFYGLLVLNRLSRNPVPGVFEEGSNAIQIRVERLR